MNMRMKKDESINDISCEKCGKIKLVAQCTETISDWLYVCDECLGTEPEYIAEPVPEIVKCSTCKHAGSNICKSGVECKWNQGQTSKDKFNCPGRCVGCEHVNGCEYAEDLD
jgi:hypothetical protein